MSEIALGGLPEEALTLLWQGLLFAAEKHREQRRKDGLTPYINHPLEVAEALWRVGQVRDIEVLLAALLHDTLEDTQTTPAELETTFGKEVCALVQEVSDEKHLPKAQRKQLQIDHAPHSSVRAKLVKLADKSCNVRDLLEAPPREWSLERRQHYLLWSDQVVAGLRGVNANLEAYYDSFSQAGRLKLGLPPLPSSLS